MPRTVNGTGQDPTVYVIRHGEKATDNGPLCEAGQIRAKDLVNVVSGSGPWGKTDHVFAKPDALFYYHYKSSAQRCHDTLVDLSKAGTSVADKLYRHRLDELGTQDATNSAAALKVRTDATIGLKKRKVVLMAWEHGIFTT